MIYGVSFALPSESAASINSLSDYGLMLCDDLVIESPTPRFKFVEVPELSGALDLTDALTGEVTYSQQQITFTLFAAHDVIAEKETPATEEHFEMLRQQFADAVNGRRLKMWLPDDPAHYFIGRVSIGAKSGYNSGKIPVAMTADPHRRGANGERVM